MLRKLFSMLRPSGRLEFAARSALCAAAVAWPLANTVNSFRWSTLPGLRMLPSEWALLAVLLVLMMLALVFFAASRLMDLGEAVTRAWLMLVPGYNLYLAVVLLTRQRAVPQGMRASDRVPALRWFALGGGVFACLLALALYVMIFVLKALLPAWGGPV